MKVRPTQDYAVLRRAAYPSIEDQLDALWKGGPEAEAMRARVEAVKTKIAKPPKSEPKKGA